MSAPRWDLEEEEPPAEEHLALLARLLGDSADGITSSGSDAEPDISHNSDGGAAAAAGSSQAESDWLQRRDAAAESDEESSGEGDARPESGEAAGSEGELSYAASERVRSQLAGLRRKSRLR